MIKSARVLHLLDHLLISDNAYHTASSDDYQEYVNDESEKLWTFYILHAHFMK